MSEPRIIEVTATWYPDPGAWTISRWEGGRAAMKGAHVRVYIDGDDGPREELEKGFRGLEVAGVEVVGKVSPTSGTA